MNNMITSMRRTVLSLLILALVLSGLGAGSVQAEGTADKKDVTYVYYVSNSNLYRVKTDGSPAQMIRKNFLGVELKQAGEFMYYLYDDSSTTLLRMDLQDEKAKTYNFGGDKRVVHFETDGDFIYFMDDTGKLYRAASSIERASGATLIADMADARFPSFSVIEGRIYYNALRNGRTTWVASKPVDGKGQPQWVAAGALENSFFVRSDNTNLHLMINTKPEETQFSVDCMVLYTVPKKGGTAKAVNAKAALDTNSVYSGSWAGNDSYLFNKGIRLGSDGDFNYANSTAQLIKKDGKTLQLNKTGIFEIAEISANKYAYVDSKGKAYVSTVANNKVASTKALPLSDVGYVRNMIKDGKVQSTVLFAQSGAYVLNPKDLTLKKMVGVEWDLCQYEENIDGIFFINAGDNSRLYMMTVDGKKATKLADEKISRIVLITKA